MTWPELMRLKRECGRGDAWCIEIYPPDDDVRHETHMRHLWITDKPGCGW